jgi:hypothetical protein
MHGPESGVSVTARRVASPLLRHDHRHSLTRGRPTSSSYSTRSIPQAASRNSRARKVGQAGSSVRPVTACSPAFPRPRPSVSRRDPRRRGTAMSVRQALTVCRLGFALARATTKSSRAVPRERAFPRRRLPYGFQIITAIWNQPSCVDCTVADVINRVRGDAVQRCRSTKPPTGAPNRRHRPPAGRRQAPPREAS